jgi:hypothetical protein
MKLELGLEEVEIVNDVGCTFLVFQVGKWNSSRHMHNRTLISARTAANFDHRRVGHQSVLKEAKR